MADGDLQGLRDAAVRIQRLSDDFWHTLDPSCATAGQAWQGPASRRFESAVRSGRSELQHQLAAAVRSAQNAVQRAHP